MSKDILTGAQPKFPAALTSYDFLKCLALALMIIDHLGYYFFPDQMWMRGMGRLSAPIWLFLIGYARTRDIGPRLWAGMIILEVSNFIVGATLLPVNILLTIILARLLIDPLMERIKHRPEALYPVSVLLFLGTIPTFLLFEYGTGAMLLVMIGYIARNREELGISKNDTLQYAAMASLGHAFYQGLVMFHFSTLEAMAMVGGIIATCLLLTGFKPREYPALTAKLPRPLVWLVQLGGRRTLEIYVLHLLLFKFTALAYGLDGYELFSFHIW